MSNFICQFCGSSIIEGDGGVYITECEHYPLEKFATDTDVASKTINVFQTLSQHEPESKTH